MPASPAAASPIAVLDTGLWQDTIAELRGSRILATIDVVNGGRARRVWRSLRPRHACHLGWLPAARSTSPAATRASRRAPNLVIVRAFNQYGAARYSDMIAGLNWVVANKTRYNIRVLNLSFGASPQSFYWDDPLNQADEAAWRAGIVVVVALRQRWSAADDHQRAGQRALRDHRGRALTDNYTPVQRQPMTSWPASLRRPDLRRLREAGSWCAAGGHIAASMSSSSYLANLDPGSMQLTPAAVHHVGHFAGRGRDLGRGGADAAA